jgi:hypothetical protein
VFGVPQEHLALCRGPRFGPLWIFGRKFDMRRRVIRDESPLHGRTERRPQRGMDAANRAGTQGPASLADRDRGVEAIEVVRPQFEDPDRAEVWDEVEVRASDHPADLHVVVQERHEVRPGVVPQPHDRWVACTPLAGELAPAFLGGGLRRGGVQLPVTVLSACSAGACLPSVRERSVVSSVAQRVARSGSGRHAP